MDTTLAAFNRASRSATLGRDDSQRLSTLVESLRSPTCYPHPVDDVEVLETHISWVLLAGNFAYKIKKPVDLGFLDFRFASARSHFCREELRLNLRTAPDLYLDVVGITGTLEQPFMGGEGPVLEHAVRMRRFPQDALFDHLARSGRLEAGPVEALARSVARFHRSLTRSPGPGGAGEAGEVIAEALRNFEQMAPLVDNAADRARLARLRHWTEREGDALRPWLAARSRGGFVRECHGDLHLGNVALIEGRPVAFDAIEFNPQFRWVDVVSDIAFTVMDLHAHGLPGLAHVFLDAWLEETGDFAALTGLRYYLVYRAMVRAKVAAIREENVTSGSAPPPAPAGRIFAPAQKAAVEERGSSQAPAQTAPDRRSESSRLLHLAEDLSHRVAPMLLVMHGPSGTGKSTVARALLEALGAVRLRSDVERKRQHGLAVLEPSGSSVGGGIYSSEANARLYSELARLTRQVLKAGYPAIVDATFLRRADREAFRQLAREAQVRFLIVSCTAPDSVLRERIGRRSPLSGDASEATLAVLDRQLSGREPLADDEIGACIAVDTSAEDAGIQAIRAIGTGPGAPLTRPQPGTS